VWTAGPSALDGRQLSLVAHPLGERLRDLVPLGDPEGARAHLRTALELEPDHLRAARIREVLARFSGRGGG